MCRLVLVLQEDLKRTPTNRATLLSDTTWHHGWNRQRARRNWRWRHPGASPGLLVGLTQHQAQGTTLALLVPPIGVVAAWTYWRQGYVDLRIAGLICVGFLIGSLLGAQYAVTLSNVSLQKAFGAFLFLLSLKLIFGKAGS